ncbi:unnamed protein product [Schistosoma margrebowiei]|uniref:Endoplasmic reticulum lectin 1 n=1 Tax=Schistosoma margrebowiei TaxID=48269 RepID=A0AA85A9P2_9TREM|nr:unnamed protein product [Schistosoma margrebowiei]
MNNTPTNFNLSHATKCSRYFEAVYAKASTKKHKKWEGDGFVEVEGRIMKLINEDLKVIASASGHKLAFLNEIDIGSVVHIGPYEAELISLIEKPQLVNLSSKSNDGTEALHAPAKISTRKPSTNPSFSPKTNSKSKLNESWGSSNHLVMPKPPANCIWSQNPDNLPIVDKIESSRPRILPGTLLSKTTKQRLTLGEHSYPYYGINYIDGTLCDLNQEHRTATVMYICHESVTGQIVDVSEIRTCQYQVVFATKFLCSNPLYKQKRAHTNPISCHSKNSSPSKPSALVALEAERRKFQSRSFTDLAALLSNAFKSKVKISAKNGKDVLFYQVNPAEDPDDESTSQVDNTKTNVNDDAKNSHDSSSFSELDVVNQVSSSLKAPSSTSSKINPSIMKSVNDNQVMEFLQGKLCLTGNLGWWTYEICFNKFIRQYHLDANTKQLQEIRLGHWDLDAHLKWFEENNAKKQKSSGSSNRQISLYYGQGDLCTETNKLREVVVKMKCLHSTSKDIYLSFSEPTKCIYSMSVESSMFCDLIPLADENDILPLDKV